nr:hypothetical protein Iba_chr14cCG2480 [Ipomoea batatas]
MYPIPCWISFCIDCRSSFSISGPTNWERSLKIYKNYHNHYLPPRLLFNALKSHGRGL